MLAGFILAAYSIVANDAIQTLGTFLSSNSRRPWWVLWIYACLILLAVLVYGWVTNEGDIAYGRLEQFPEPQGGITWLHAIPPVFILLLTRYGVPVSTTFLVLTVFAPTNLLKILTKSLLGYGVAIGVGFVLYLIVANLLESRFMATKDRPPRPYAVALQWLATAFLWSQWLIQDLANIFVYLPRTAELDVLIFAAVVMLVLHAVIFRNRGGRIQRIVTSKTNTTDIRTATLIDFIYATILLYFKEMSNIPMSTTWVFLGLLAGRELALAFRLRHRTISESILLAGKDVGKAAIGLAVSVVLAIGLPILDRSLQQRFSDSAAGSERVVEVSAGGPRPTAQVQAPRPKPAPGQLPGFGRDLRNGGIQPEAESSSSRSLLRHSPRPPGRNA